ncbi:interferon-inducible double-stranded RNA-dependent protein kinase activator A homolog B-like [Rhopalosiphum maidis]|uniref:interferon-inducible double-stranded RNA-dependent protein kinase activator A homolog B-like n=2 Tax=Rhopalosiphum maidis TaxID=43146 RepID=UPI000EFFDD4E|nr:interferon-inducible double-stranded RNA-dependent protein kinase activator A homolog B-like [Rhopalosiphum maidis]XP_026806755.1 interferon-inducible double-stranded RNA-dependent protein kinase activator A homolog B-like [Rhopalosiphum maidis]XP_026806756.1 interferon-inducible double-stranded RNA-dependent protein kinase activator A homolog B-like [Rhopalosiphum maidis]XP_026821508.1 interferon-inducible double-stranded RNA-dependent protein kinase activator A homolog B-like [Rhopalosiphum
MCADSNGFLPFSVKDDSSSQSEISLNPVGSLQELCMARRCPFPNYTFPVDKLKKHKAEFRVVCSISIYKCSGTGISKQVAKNQAAYLMYKQIEKLTSEDFKQIWKNEYEYKDEIHNDPSLIQHHELPHSIKFTKLALSHESVTHLKSFFDSGAPKITHLQKIKKNSTASDTLNTILKIEDITLKCLTVSFNSGKVEVMMQVNTIPVIVISGSGKSVSDAQESAARVILSYFKSKLNIQ